ncbi:MAG: transporter substrate-binding domain-containing protein [Acidovorax sp.]|nr:MAG: transporter substrate-binding domain-containing protein [Acidovorax sp.]
MYTPCRMASFPQASDTAGDLPVQAGPIAAVQKGIAAMSGLRRMPVALKEGRGASLKRGLRRWRLALLPALMLLTPGSAAGVEVVRYPIPESAADQRYDYPRKLLELVLSKTRTAYRVEYPTVSMSQNRQIIELEAGRTIDVSALPSSAEREARLLPIRVPLNKGLLGWRLGLVRKGDTHRVAQIKTLSDLMGVRLAQGQDWPDTQILSGNGLEVINGSTYEGLFKMLESQRFDYFPRSVMEIWDEQEAHASTLEIEPHLALHYFYDSYFFVNKRNTKLAADISEGMEKAIADGSFDKLFNEHWGERVRKARLNDRTVIELRNPLLTPETPSNRRELWYGVRR